MRFSFIFSYVCLTYFTLSAMESEQDFLEDPRESIRKNSFYRIKEDKPGNFRYELNNPDGLEESVLLENSIKAIQQDLASNSNLSARDHTRLQKEVRVLQKLLESKK